LGGSQRAGRQISAVAVLLGPARERGLASGRDSHCARGSPRPRRGRRGAFRKIEEECAMKWTTVAILASAMLSACATTPKAPALQTCADGTQVPAEQPCPPPPPPPPVVCPDGTTVPAGSVCLPPPPPPPPPPQFTPPPPGRAGEKG
jgi:hypothetical protein